jgi:hypothetical protein
MFLSFAFSFQFFTRLTPVFEEEFGRFLFPPTKTTVAIVGNSRCFTRRSGGGVGWFN